MSQHSVRAVIAAAIVASLALTAAPALAQDAVPSFEQLLAQPVALKPELAGVHPRVFVTAKEIEALRVRAKTTHKDEWARALATLAAVGQAPPPPPGPQERRSQNVVGLQIAGVSLAWAVEQDPKYLKSAKAWTLAAIDYEPWGYTYNKPNTDLAAGHLLYAIGWAYDLLYHEWTPDERGRIRQSLERHAGLVYDAFAPKPKRRHSFTQNHNFIPDSRPRRHGARAHGRVGRRAEVGRPGPRASSPGRAAAQPGRLLLRRHRVLDLLRAVARALPRRVGAFHGREPLGPRPVQELEILDRPLDPAGRPDRVRLRRHLAGPAHAGEAGRGLRARVSDAARSRATSTCSTAWRRASRTGRRRPSRPVSRPSATRTRRNGGRCCGAIRRSRPRR